MMAIFNLTGSKVNDIQAFNVCIQGLQHLDSENKHLNYSSTVKSFIFVCSDLYLVRDLTLILFLKNGQNLVQLNFHKQCDPKYPLVSLLSYGLFNRWHRFDASSYIYGQMTSGHTNLIFGNHIGHSNPNHFK